MATLEEELLGCGAVKFGDFKLASGKKSQYYVDVKKASVNPCILRKIAEEIKTLIESHDITIDAIACVELGGVPIGTAVSLELNKPLIIIRKQPKDHGISSPIIGEVKKGMVVLLVEDVTTTGGSAIKAIEALRNAGSIVFYAISVVDRDEGAYQNLDKIGVNLIYIVNAIELLQKQKQKQ